MDPATAATKFYDAALRVDGVESMTDIEVVRAVQRNVNPETYAQYRAMARDLLLDRALGCEPLGVSFPGDSTLVSPLTGTGISSRYGDRWHPVSGAWSFHAGSDLPAPHGTPIAAAATGMVSHTSCTSWKGRSPCQIVLEHGDGIETWYVHMYPDGVFVSPGQVVQTGEVIGAVGSNGQSTGPHLHFEVHVNGKTVDPEAWYLQRGGRLG